MRLFLRICSSRRFLHIEGYNKMFFFHVRKTFVVSVSDAKEINSKMYNDSWSDSRKPPYLKCFSSWIWTEFEFKETLNSNFIEDLISIVYIYRIYTKKKNIFTNYFALFFENHM